MWGPIDLGLRTLKALPALLATSTNGRRTTADDIEEQARVRPEHAFLLFGENGEPRRVSYGELNAHANRVARWAIHHGLRTGDVVALLMENRPEYVPTWAGLAKLGITTALINTNVGGQALRHALATSEARTLIAGTECLDHLTTTIDDLERPLDLWLVHQPDGAATPTHVPDGAHDLDADLATREADDLDPSIREELRAGDDLFYIYTSGTSGLPKAARFSHLRFRLAGVAAALGLRLDPADVHYCALPLYHSAGGVMMVSTALAAGATLALRRRFSARAFWDDCRRFGASRSQYIGEFCRYLLNQPPRDDDRDHPVRFMIGNGLRPDIWTEFQRRFEIEHIIEFYGATEGLGLFVNLRGKVGAVGRMPLGRLGRRLGIARIVRYDVERDELVRDERGFCIDCEPGEPGELINRVSEGGSVLWRFEGYTSRKASEKKVLRDVFEPGDSWYRSGDLLQRDSSNWLYFVDRIGDTFRWKGENVSTQEVAEILGGFPGLEMVNVYGVRVDGREGRAGMATLLVAGERDRFDPQAFYRFVNEALPSYAAPVFVRLVDEPEVTGTLKLRKVTLKEEGFDPEQIRDPLFLRDDAAGSYTPLTPELCKRLLAGELPL
jgi:fatty-acyl-CoA synthase